MGRFNTTGLPFLVWRADGGQFTYMRTLPKRISALVIGDVELSWCNGSRALAGKPVIKITLGTGDRATARLRWSHVHPQVATLVRLAEIRLEHPSSEADAPTEVICLTPEQLRTMSDQAYHRILSDDDRAVIDPSYTSPIADIMLRLAVKGGVAPAVATTDVARRAARKVQQQLAKHHLINRQIEPYSDPSSSKNLTKPLQHLCRNRASGSA